MRGAERGSPSYAVTTPAELHGPFGVPILAGITIMIQPLCRLLTSVSLLAPAVVPPKTVPAGEMPSLALPATLDPAAQRQAVRQVLTRLDRANRIVLAPEEVAIERARAILLMRQMTQGKLLPPAELDRLLQQTDQREKAAIERLARQFRLEVYRTFRQRRGLFTRLRGDVYNLAPCYVTEEAQIDRMVQILGDSIDEILGA